MRWQPKLFDAVIPGDEGEPALAFGRWVQDQGAALVAQGGGAGHTPR